MSFNIFEVLHKVMSWYVLARLLFVIGKHLPFSKFYNCTYQFVCKSLLMYFTFFNAYLELNVRISENIILDSQINGNFV